MADGSRRRPTTQNAIAEIYDLLVDADEGRPPSAATTSAKVLEARTALANYIGDTPWVDANKDNPAALQRAEELVRGGSARARRSRTRTTARRRSSRPTRPAIRRSSCASRRTRSQEYKLAAIGWLGYLKQDENAPDAYKSRYFYADALHNQVRLEVALHAVRPEGSTRSRRPQEIATAKRAAVDVRDSDEDDQFIDNAGLFVVDLADVDRDLAFQRWQDSSGTQGRRAAQGRRRSRGPTGTRRSSSTRSPTSSRRR